MNKENLCKYNIYIMWYFLQLEFDNGFFFYNINIMYCYQSMATCILLPMSMFNTYIKKFIDNPIYCIFFNNHPLRIYI